MEEAMMVEVGPHSAFGVNKIGFGRASFPLSFVVRMARGVWMVTATAAQAVELADVLVRSANDTIVVVGVDATYYLDEEDGLSPPSPSQIAAEQGISHDTHLLDGLASTVVSEEALVIRRDDLPRFLTGWSSYNLVWIDVPGAPTPDQIDEIALTIGTTNYPDPVLPELVGSRVCFFGHDDCYVTVESTDSAVAPAVLGRLLALLVGSALVDVSPVDLADPGGLVTETLIEKSPRWVGLLGAVSEHSVTVDLAAVAEPWRLGEQLPERPDHTVTYDVHQRIWRSSLL
jgi:hypothetical protein